MRAPAWRLLRKFPSIAGARRADRRRRGEPSPADTPDRHQLIAATTLIALCTLPLLPELDRQVGAFVVGILVLRGVAIRWPRWRPGMAVLALLTVVGGANVLDAYHSIWGRNPGTALLLSMVALKLLEVRSLRDLRVLLLVFYFLLVGGAIGLIDFQFARIMDMMIVLHARPVAFPAAGFVGGFVYWLIARPSAEPAPSTETADQ